MNEKQEREYYASFAAAKEKFRPGMWVEWTMHVADYSNGMAFKDVILRGYVNKVGDIVEVRMLNGDFRYVHVLDLRVAEERAS
jgi:hypothetical protein